MKGKMSLHDMNSYIYANAEPLAAEELTEVKQKIADFHLRKNNKTYLLLSHDIRYYSILQKEESADINLANNVLDCLSYLGDIVDITDEQGCLGFWLKQTKRAAFVMLIPYDFGVISFT
jgi:hypothetical protein